MSSVESAYSSTSRITGLFSDLDTDTLVEDMCSIQQSKIDKHKQKLTTYEWYTDALEEVADLVDEFSSSYCSGTNSSQRSMLKASTYYAYSVTTDSDSSAVRLTSSASALLGKYTVEVQQLAINASASSSARVSADGTEISAYNTTTLADLSLANDLAFGSDGKISFKINGVQFGFSADTTLQTMINTINNDDDANVTMKYSRLTDTFTITADSGGADSSVTISNLSGNAFGENSAFGIQEGTYSKSNNNTTACDSIAVINGTTITRDSNEYDIDGITFELNSVTKGTDEESLTFRVERDYSATVSAITNFVDALNALITKLDSRVSADDESYDYPPLTDAQKKEMSEEEIESWENKAKSGILHHDSNLETLISSLKNAFYASAGGTGSSAASIGIAGGSYYGSDSGLLVVDTDALTKALKADPEKVIAIFTSGSSTAVGSDKGILYKIKSAFSIYSDAAEESLDTTDDRIDDVEDEVDKLKDKLEFMAERYYAQFSQMETALATLNSQASYISALFNS